VAQYRFEDGDLDQTTPGIWYRVQPAGCGLDHRSETSEGELSDGCHVHQTLAQAIYQEGRALFLHEGGYELVVIHGPKDLRDTQDVEGWILPLNAGVIVARYDYENLCEQFS